MQARRRAVSGRTGHEYYLVAQYTKDGGPGAVPCTARYPFSADFPRSPQNQMSKKWASGEEFETAGDGKRANLPTGHEAPAAAWRFLSSPFGELLVAALLVGVALVLSITADTETMRLVVVACVVGVLTALGVAGWRFGVWGNKAAEIEISRGAAAVRVALFGVKRVVQVVVFGPALIAAAGLGIYAFGGGHLVDDVTAGVTRWALEDVQAAPAGMARIRTCEVWHLLQLPEPSVEYDMSPRELATSSETGDCIVRSSQLQPLERVVRSQVQYAVHLYFLMVALTLGIMFATGRLFDFGRVR